VRKVGNESNDVISEDIKPLIHIFIQNLRSSYIDNIY
jgi:hypothetical protein